MSLQYIGEITRPWFERIFWMAAFTISTVGCALLIAEMINKLQTNPITVSLAERQSSIAEVMMMWWQFNSNSMNFTHFSSVCSNFRFHFQQSRVSWDSSLWRWPFSLLHISLVAWCSLLWHLYQPRLRAIAENENKWKYFNFSTTEWRRVSLFSSFLSCRLYYYFICSIFLSISALLYTPCSIICVCFWIFNSKARFQAISVICKPNSPNLSEPYIPSGKFVQILREISSYKWFERQSATWNNIYGVPFVQRLTPYGSCFSFNIIDFGDLLNAAEWVMENLS